MSRQEHSCDVAILGAGFTGSLMALVAQRLGLSVALLEKGQHPRFAIGESSTPLANLKLACLAERYGLDALRPFTRYGSWKSHRPDIACGLKRGFSFFKHEAGRAFQSSSDHDRELLVAANRDERRGDTHWYRSEFDHFVNQQVCDADILYRDLFLIDEIRRDDRCVITGHDQCDDLEISARFCIDATGPAAILASTQPEQSTAIDTTPLRTESRTLFGHFRDVLPWSDVLADRHLSTRDHVFPCDASALHHIIDGGWMWVLHFDNGLTSAGFSLSPSQHPIVDSETPEQEWMRLTSAYPSIHQQFAHAKPVIPMHHCDRGQRKLPHAAGDGWLAMHHTAGFVDPWLSPGLAHALYGVERAAGILESLDDSQRVDDLMRDYDRRFASELDLIDRITSTCFANLDRFESLTHIVMLYFAAAITCEERIRAGDDENARGFLLADDSTYLEIVESCCKTALDRNHNSGELGNLVRDQLKPYNSAGLCDPSRRNMYPFTGTV